MLIFDKIAPLQKELKRLRSNGKKIGFVPTMGALHAGHLSLITSARESNDVVVASIFVNPTQFNNAEDLNNYPRTPEADIELLRKAGTDIVFIPPTDEIYNDSNRNEIIPEPGSIAEVMEGIHRPGHFKGVMMVVTRLFKIVEPINAYFGEKDYQQLAIIRFMVKELKQPVNIIACPTVREKNGLAMSSRNLRLTESEKKKAGVISESLNYISRNWNLSEEEKLIQNAKKMIEQEGFKVEYIEVADSEKLQPAKKSPNKKLRAFAAVFCGDVRLIDNIPVN
jgi:pantoate--beta-alanine ligase